jgi:orotate phosphoribosyltransferase
MKQISEKVIQGLIDIKAISINLETPFIWASGIKSPIYCDNRKSIGHYELRSTIAQGLSEAIKTNYPDVELIGGTATAGIPHATSVADNMQLPLVYFRSKPKDHGTGSVIEGDYQKGQKIVIVEDLISTGGSVLQCVDYAKAAGLEVLGVVAIFSYELEAAVKNFATANISITSLTGFNDLYEVLNLETSAREFINLWRKNVKDSSIWEK